MLMFWIQHFQSCMIMTMAQVGMPTGVSEQQWRNRKDWTYYSRRSMPNTVGAISLGMFDSTSGGYATDNIPQASAFPNSYKFYLARLGFMIMPQLSGLISTAGLYAAMNTIIQNGMLRLKVMNEVYFEKPISNFFNKISIGPDATVKMTSGELDLIGTCLLNKGILFDKGSNFTFTLETVTTADSSTLISKVEARMEGFLIEAQ